MKVLAANDGSANAFKALDAAANLARRCGAELHIIVVDEARLHDPSPELLVEQQQRIDKRMAERRTHLESETARHDLQAHIHVFEGHPTATIVEFCKSETIDLLVIGATGHGKLQELLLGSRAGHLVQLAPCAVLVVK